MSDLIDRQTAISAICNACGKIDCDRMDKCEKLQLPPANSSEFPNSSDCISRQAAIDALDVGAEVLRRVLDEADVVGVERAKYEWGLGLIESHIADVNDLPSAQPEQHYDEWCDDCKEYDKERHCCPRWNRVIRQTLKDAQPERTCVNCGRTVNNGGWYADGRTRCPIEEHYTLPKDGYCHLWEKRNITDDDYPERQEE